jgi:hypothetical protein
MNRIIRGSSSTTSINRGAVLFSESGMFSIIPLAQWLLLLLIQRKARLRRNLLGAKV